MITGMTRVERVLIESRSGEAFLEGLALGYLGRRKPASAAARWADFREAAGYRNSAANILTSAASQHKLSMSDEITVGLMLTPERGIMRDEFADLRAAYGLGGAWNLCAMASDGCAAACLSFSGQSGMPAQQFAQGVRTLFMLSHPCEFMALIGFELGRLSAKHGGIAVRLNTVSDIRFEHVIDMDLAREHTASGSTTTPNGTSQRPERPGYDLTRSSSSATAWLIFKIWCTLASAWRCHSSPVKMSHSRRPGRACR